MTPPTSALAITRPRPAPSRRRREARRSNIAVPPASPCPLRHPRSRASPRPANGGSPAAWPRKDRGTDPLGRATTSTYDAQRRLLTSTDPLGGVTSYSYDLAGQVTSVTDPDKNQTTYAYDAAGRQTSVTDPLGHASTYAYDNVNQLTSMTDRDGRTTTYSYDAIGERTGETWVGGSYTATYTYDAAGEQTGASDTYSTYTYGYDNAGRLTSVDNNGTSGVPHVVLSYTYDYFNNRTGLSDSLGGGIGYTFDAAHRLTNLSMSLTGGTALVTLNYDNANRLSSILQWTTGGDQISATFGYDNADRLTGITDTDTTKSTTLASYSYSYDNASQLTGYSGPDGSLSYTYDNTGQLTGVSGSQNATYTYDANGNRNMTGYSTGTGNELTSDGTYSYTYDNAGNMASQTDIATSYVTDYTWDYRNRLTEVKQEDNHGNVLNDEKFTYDVDNNRIGVSLNSVQQLYTVYDGANPYMDFNGSGTLTERYLANPTALNQMYARVSAGGTVNWYLTDNLGSVRQIVDASGNVLDGLTYSPFGSIVSETNASNGDRFKYADGEYDSITGQYRFRERWYGPGDGRFGSQDPSGFGGGDSNLYRYVFNAPTTRTDPTGLRPPPGSYESYDYDGLPNWLANTIDGAMQLPNIVGDLGRAGYALGYMGITGEAYVPQWYSLTAQSMDQAIQQGGRDAGNAVIAQHWMNTIFPWIPMYNTVYALVYKGDPTPAEHMIGGMWFGAAFFGGLADPIGDGPVGIRPMSCFPAGTPVHTAVGLRAIEQIRAGQRVWAYDHKQLCWAVREVVTVYQLLHQGTMATVQVKGETLRATGGHPFWVVRGEGLAERPLPKRIAAYETGGRQEGRWVLARDLRAGDEVLLRHAGVVRVESVRLDEVEERVYNFHVAELQNYAVGSCGVLVHNTNDSTGSYHEPPTGAQGTGGPGGTSGPGAGIPPHQTGGFGPGNAPAGMAGPNVSQSGGVGGLTVWDQWGWAHEYIPPQEWPLWFPGEAYPPQWANPSGWTWPNLP